MKSTGTMQLLAIAFLGLATFTSSVQGARRVLKVRKTGEFGRRIPAVSLYYEPPRRLRELDPFSENTGSIRSLRLASIVRKPSQRLELPILSPQDHHDSIAAETGESPQGYAYRDPDTPQGYFYMMNGSPKNGKKPTLAPLAEFANQDQGDDAQQRIDDDPQPVHPEREAEFPVEPKPFGAETQQETSADEVAPRSAAPPRPVQPERTTGENAESASDSGYKNEIPGEAGTDYPILNEVVDTSFDCENVPYSGYYADTDPQSRCQIFHICLKSNAHRRTQKWSFLCPNGTLFSQDDLVCVWWHSAPDCNAETVRQLGLKNEELGWDNGTDTEGGNLQASGSTARRNNASPPQTTRRSVTPSSKNAIPYRVPVKVNQRTQLKEVTGNSIQGEGDDVEYTGQESGSYETSLRRQSESRHRSKTASALSKSESEAYEQKSVPDSGLSPFIVNRPRDEGEEGDEATQVEPVQQGPYEDEQPVPEVVMMRTQQKNPDGSESSGEVPVMMPAGYRYPTPATPFLGYLPPRRETTTDVPPQPTTFIPSTEHSINSGYQEHTTEVQTTIPSTVAVTEQGYQYPTPTVVTTTPEVGYTYPSPAITTSISTEQPSLVTSGYTSSSPIQTTTQQGHQEVDDITTVLAPVTEAVYTYDTSTSAVETTTYSSPTTTNVPSFISSTTPQQDNSPNAYLPPRGAARPRSSNAEQTGNLLTPPRGDDNNQEETTVSAPSFPTTENPTTPPIDIFSSAVTGESDIGERSTGGYTSSPIPTTSSPSVSDDEGPSGSGPGGEDAAHAPGGDENDERVNQILQEIQNGGAEVRDENGRALNYDELKQLILSNPDGALSLQKADETETEKDTDADTNAVAPSPPSHDDEEPVIPTETEAVVPPPPPVEENPGPKLEEVKHIVETPERLQQYLPVAPPQIQQLSHQTYFSNDRLVSLKRPGYEISAPSSEYESHTQGIVKNQVEQGQLNSQSSPFRQSPSSFQTLQPNNPYQDSIRNVLGTSSFGSNAGNNNDAGPQRQKSLSSHFTIPISSQLQQPEVSFLRPSDPIPQPQVQLPHQPVISDVRNNEIVQRVPRPESLLPGISNNNPPQQSQFIQNQQQVQPTRSHVPPSSSSSTPFSPPFTQQLTRPRPRTPLIQQLSNQIQFELSRAFQFPGARGSSSSSSGSGTNNLDIKVVPALLVNRHTRVERPNGQRELSPTQGNEERQNSLFSSQSQFSPVLARLPRLTSSFTYEDALPKKEKFTAEEGRTIKQIKKRT